MSSIRHDNDAGPADFPAEVRDSEPFWITVTYAVIGLTNFGEREVPSARLAEVLGRPVSKVEARRARLQTATPAEDPLARAEDGLITYINPDLSKSRPRRWLQIGDRRSGMTGCARRGPLRSADPPVPAGG